MRIGNAIVVGVVTIIAVVLVGAVVSVATVIDRAALDDADARLERAQGVFEELSGYRRTLHRSELRVVADEPRLKAAVATEDPHIPTILGVVQTMQKTVESDLFLLVDGEGRLIVDATAKDQSPGASLADRPVVRGALDNGHADAVWAGQERVFLVQAQRMAFGSQVVGAVVIGHALDDDLAAAVFRQTGSPVAVVYEGQVSAAAGFDRSGRDELAGPLADRARPEVRGRVTIAGTDYLVAGSAFPGYAGDRALGFAVLVNLDAALAPGRRLSRIVYGLLGVGVFLALAFAILLSRRVSGPLAGLVKFTRRVAAGDLSPRETGWGPSEVRELESAMNRMVEELDSSRKQVAEKQRMENELEIAATIQTSILPTRLSMPGLDIAALMKPTSEVGGDYYDAIPVLDGGWLAIGDVAGHGLTSGLVMLMARTSVAALVEASPDRSPRDLLIPLNRVLYESVNHRMGRDRHMTMSVVRYHSDGRIVVAGAHLDLIILRADTGEVEYLEVPGTWLGMVEDISAVTEEREETLRDGDIVVLYTDGVLEAMNKDGEMFGDSRLRTVVQECRGADAEVVLQRIFASVEDYAESIDDDISVLVMRYRRGGKEAVA